MYDATPYLEDHPGGAESILISAGGDATDEFNSIHSSKAKAMLAQYYIGDLVASKLAAAAVPEDKPLVSTSVRCAAGHASPLKRPPSPSAAVRLRSRHIRPAAPGATVQLAGGSKMALPVCPAARLGVSLLA